MNCFCSKFKQTCGKQCVELFRNILVCICSANWSEEEDHGMCTLLGIIDVKGACYGIKIITLILIISAGMWLYFPTVWHLQSYKAVIIQPDYSHELDY